MNACLLALVCRAVILRIAHKCNCIVPRVLAEHGIEEVIADRGAVRRSRLYRENVVVEQDFCIPDITPAALYRGFIDRTVFTRQIIDIYRERKRADRERSRGGGHVIVP